MHDANSEQAALILLDKLDKQGRDSIVAQFSDNLSVDAKHTNELLDLLGSFRADNTASLTKYFDEPAIKEEWTRFQQTLQIVQDLSADSVGKVVMNLSIARGLAYYTGIVYETTVDGVSGFGSICSGGRYDNLAERFIDQDLPGVGISIGVDRLTALLCEKEGTQTKAPADVYIAVASSDAVSSAFALANFLREAGISTDIALREQKLGTQFKNADKRGFPWVIAVGGEEAASRLFPLKNMKTGVELKGLSREKLLEELSSSKRD